MADIRKKVLQFAKNAEGTRIWARTHRVRQNRLLPLVQTYNWRGDTLSCDTVDWSSDETHILSDRGTRNDFRGQDRMAWTSCNFGFGECWDLAYAALQKHNGLTRASLYTGRGRIWSDQTLHNLSNLQGGEILEIRPTVYFFKMTYEESGGQINGYGPSSWSQIGPHIPHTAVIKSADRAKKRVEVYHQNFVSSGTRNLLVHVAVLPIMNATYRENGYRALQLCGANQVRQFTNRFRGLSNSTTSQNFGTRNIQRRWKNLIRDIKTYINNNNNLPDKIDIYVPHSR